MPSERERIHDEVISLREYIDMKIAYEQEIRDEWRRMNEQLVQMAKEEVADKLNKMNEVRERINQERGMYQNRSEYVDDMKALDGRLKLVENLLANFQGRIAIGGSIFGLAIVLISHYWK